MRNHLVLCLVLLNALPGCSTAAPAAPQPVPAEAGVPVDFCTSCATPTARGTVANKQVAEASGIAASRTYEGVFYVENDSGDSARFFAIGDDGSDLGSYAVDGLTATDWEDIAVGPCPEGSCVHIADIGDNAEKRTSYVVYRTAEPSDLGAGKHAVTVEAFPFEYPDGSHNAETLLVHPTTGVITIVTKTATGPSGIYEFPMPLTAGTRTTLVKKGELKAPGMSPLFTGGDVGSRGVLLRTYSNVLLYPLAEGQSAAEALAGAPCMTPTPEETQGEAVGWTADGKGYFTVGEGVSQSVNHVVCAP